MPLYEYVCEACGHEYEKMQKFSDPLDNTCPKCHGAVHKKMSNPSFQLKGGGWYKDGYASAGKSSGSESAPKSEKKDTKTKEKP